MSPKPLDDLELLSAVWRHRSPAGRRRTWVFLAALALLGVPVVIGGRLWPGADPAVSGDTAPAVEAPEPPGEPDDLTRYDRNAFELPSLPAPNPPVFLGDPQILENLSRMVQPGLVSVRSSHGTGVGFVVGEGLVVTAYHVVVGKRAASLVVTPRRAPPVKVVRIVAGDRDLDIALLEIAPLAISPYNQRLKALPLASKRPRRGDEIAVFSHLGGAHAGRVDRVNRFDLACRVWSYPGCSGSPIVNRHGQVVGILTRADESRRRGFGTPASAIAELLRQAEGGK